MAPSGLYRLENRSMKKTAETSSAPGAASGPHSARWVVGVVLLAAAAIGAALFRSQRAGADPVQPPTGDWLAVVRGDFDVVVREDGDLRPVKVTTIGFTRWGKLAWMAPDGSRVRKG